MANVPVDILGGIWEAIMGEKKGPEVTHRWAEKPHGLGINPKEFFVVVGVLFAVGLVGVVVVTSPSPPPPNPLRQPETGGGGDAPLGLYVVGGFLTAFACTCIAALGAFVVARAWASVQKARADVDRARLEARTVRADPTGVAPHLASRDGDAFVDLNAGAVVRAMNGQPEVDPDTDGARRAATIRLAAATGKPPDWGSQPPLLPRVREVDVDGD